MSKVKEIQKVISSLSESDFSSFRKWFDEFDAKIWDEQFEEDVEAGNLDKLADEAIKQFKAGECVEL